MNYTIILHNLDMNNDTVFGPKKYSHADQDWPFVREVIQSDIGVNTEYSVSVGVSTSVGSSYRNKSATFSKFYTLSVQ